MLYRLKQLTLILGDLVALYAGLYLALSARYLAWPPAGQIAGLLPPMTWLFSLAVVLAFIVGLYDLGQAKNNWRFFRKVLICAGFWIALSVVYFYINPNVGANPKTILVLTALFGFGLISFWRLEHNKFLSTEILKTRVVFVGLTPEILELVKIIREQPQRGFELVGIIIKQGENLSPELNLRTAFSFSQLKALGGEINLIVVAPDMAGDMNLAKELYDDLFRQISISSLAKFYEELMGRIPPFTFSEAWFLNNLNEQQKKIYDRFRILVDYFFALLIGLVFAITFPFVALAIKLNSPGPLFYIHERVGRGGKIFKMYKYRTMKALNHDGGAEQNGPQFASIGDDRITGVGQILRRTRLDEIPQFINILTGDMGLIGPRPERPTFVSQLTTAMPFYALRHLIKPGLTGWAQIHNSYYGNLEENLKKLEYDLYYIKNRGPLLDLAISLRTVNIIVRMIGR